MVISALVTAAATAPLAGVVAYWNHEEAVQRLSNDRAHQEAEARLAERRLSAEQRQASCAGALTYLEDEKPNPALAKPQAKLLLEDMRRTASICALPAAAGSDPTLSSTSIGEGASRE